jgi:hypothetical protein
LAVGNVPGTEDEKTKSDLLREVTAHAAALAGQEPTATERALATTAALCWVALRRAEARADCADSSQRTLRQAEHPWKRSDHAHRRYRATLKLLAVVRRLAVPTMQVKIARQQVVTSPAP